MGHKYTMESRIQMSKSAEKRANTKKYKEWFKKHNPSFNEEIMKRKSENVKLLGIYKGENNPRYIDNLNIKEIIDLYINKKMIINDIAKKFGVGRGTIRRRLQKENIKVFRGQRV
jgi:DNA invertase Pin-like site-specific DNA recombinase